jgi:hypothetical protein
MQVTVESHFRIDWHTLTISKKETHVSLGIQVGTKRNPVYDDNSVLINTIPKVVMDLGGQDVTILKYEVRKLEEQLSQSIHKDRFNELEEQLEAKEAALIEAKEAVLTQATTDQKVSPKKVTKKETKKVTKKRISHKDEIAAIKSEFESQIAAMKSDFEKIIKEKDEEIARLKLELAKRDDKSESKPAESQRVQPKVKQISQKWQGTSKKPKVPNKPVVQPPKYTDGKLQGPSNKPNKPSGGYYGKKVKPPPKGNDTS